MNTKRADQRRAGRADPAAGRRRQHGLGADHGQGARHHPVGGQARQVRRLRRLHQADGEDRASRRARSPAPASPTASRASSRSRASTSTPRSAATCSTPPTTTCRASSACSARCCGENGVNIANFTLGRNRPGGDAIALLYLDAPFPEPVLEKVRAPQVDRVRPSGCSSTSRGCDRRIALALHSSSRPSCRAAGLGKPDAAEHQRHGDGVIGAEILAEDDDATAACRRSAPG